MSQHTTQNGDAGKSPPWGKVVAVAARDKRFSEKHYRTLIALTSYANWKTLAEIGDAWPVFATIEDTHGIAKGTLSRCTKDLASWGYLLIEKRANPRGGRPANRYLIPLDVQVPLEFDIANFRRSGTSEYTELGTSITTELATSTDPELASSKGRNFNREQTKGTDQTRSDQNQQTTSSHSCVVAAASQQRPSSHQGVPIETLADADGRVRLKIGMPAPSFVFKQHLYRVGLAKTAWRNAPPELRQAVWEAFLGAKAGKDWGAATVSAEFTKWVCDRIGRAYDGTPRNSDPFWRQFDSLPDLPCQSELKIEHGMELPQALSQIANGNRLWGDIRPKRWAQFVGEHAGQQFTTETLRTTFQAWCKKHRVWEEADEQGMRRDPTSENTQRERGVAMMREARQRSLQRERVDQPPPPPAPPPQFHIIANMKPVEWAHKYTQDLNQNDWRPQWGVWTCDNHNKRMGLIEAQVSWSRFCHRALQYELKRGNYHYGKPGA